MTIPSAIETSIFEVHPDIAESIDEDDWSVNDENMLQVGPLVFEVLGDPEEIDDALLLASCVTTGVH